ncbi:MAG: alanine racemase [Planctomycetota bacterium]|nr:alanine racemase [Planctomycetota bacterium]
MSTRLPYEKPTIVRHTVGLMNKFGRTSSTFPHGRIDGVPLRQLVDEHGSPLWVLSEAALRRKYRDVYRAFALRYPRVVIAYSYKTNYLSGVCAALHQEGAWAEVVSGMEYEFAQRLGVPGDRIVFNGPHKTQAELERAIDNNSKVNIDSYDEMYMIEEIAKSRKRQLEVGLRVNMELNYPPWDRFGFNVESGQAFEACKRIISSQSLRLNGLHVHVGTYISDVAVYQQMAERLSALCYRLQNELATRVAYLDVGGGHASKNTLHTAWMPAEHTCPTPDQYAEAICPALLRGPFDPKEMPLLILEPGRSVVDEAMFLVASVVAVKRLSSGVKGIVIDAGVNILPTAWWYRHDIVPGQDTGSIGEEVNIYGPLCMQIDVIRTGVTLPPLRRGDLVLIKNVGAYNFPQSMQFIQPRPAIVTIFNGKVDVLRERETVDYIRGLDRLPDRLKGGGKSPL